METKKFYKFTQNNSGGEFVVNEFLNVYVFVEADSADEANERAMKFGVYFNGVERGIDCECYGDRWYSVCELNVVYKCEIYRYPSNRVSVLLKV